MLICNTSYSHTPTLIIMGKRKREDEDGESDGDGEEEVKKTKKSKKSKGEDVSEPEVVEKKSKKAKEEKENSKETKSSAPIEVPVKTYEELIELVSVIAKPMANKKLTKKLYKVVKKSQSAKRTKRGVREVVKGLRKDMKGLVVLAGDISPIDVISHIPVYCEDKGVPYCYVPSRRELGAACLTRRPTSVVMVQPADDYATLYQECYDTVDALPLPI